MVFGVVTDPGVESVAHGEERGAHSRRDVVSWIKTSSVLRAVAAAEPVVSPGGHEHRRFALDDLLRQTGSDETADDAAGEPTVQADGRAAAPERDAEPAGVVPVQLEVRPVGEQSPGGTGRREGGAHGRPPAHDDRPPPAETQRVDSAESVRQVGQGPVWVAAEQRQVPDQRIGQLR